MFSIFFVVIWHYWSWLARLFCVADNERVQLAEQRERLWNADHHNERSVSRALAQVPAAATRGPLRGGYFAGADRNDRRPRQLACALRFHQVRWRANAITPKRALFNGSIMWKAWNNAASMNFKDAERQNQVNCPITLKAHRAISFKPERAID